VTEFQSRNRGNAHINGDGYKSHEDADQRNRDPTCARIQSGEDVCACAGEGVKKAMAIALLDLGWTIELADIGM
jgi:hypothetical protein